MKAPALPAGTAHLRLLEVRVPVDGNETGTMTTDVVAPRITTEIMKIDTGETRSIESGTTITRRTGREAIGRDTRTTGTGRAGMTSGIEIGVVDATTTTGIREMQVVATAIGKEKSRGTIVIEGPG